MTDPLRKCPACKAVVEPGDQFCGFCGSAVEGAPPPPAPPGPPTPSRPTAPPGLLPQVHPERPTAQKPPRPDPDEGVSRDQAPASGTEPAGGTKESSTAESSSAMEQPEPAGSPRPGFWIRNRGWGLLLLRLGFAALLLYGWNPEMVGTIEDGRGWDLVNQSLPWVRLPVGMDFPELFYAVVATHMIAGSFIALGLLFRPACLVVAASWGFILFLQITVEGAYFGLPEITESAALLLIFLGLMIAGPGRLALGRAERKGRAGSR